MTVPHSEKFAFSVTYDQGGVRLCGRFFSGAIITLIRLVRALLRGSIRRRILPAQLRARSFRRVRAEGFTQVSARNTVCRRGERKFSAARSRTKRRADVSARVADAPRAGLAIIIMPNYRLATSTADGSFLQKKKKRGKKPN